jgi:membrane protein
MRRVWLAAGPTRSPHNDRVAFAYFRVPIRWTEVVRRTVNEISDDNCFGLAAQLAFYFLLALFPAILFFVALLGYLPVDNAFADLLAALGTVAPGEFVSVVRQQLDQIAQGEHAGLLTIGIAGAIWSSSAGMVAIIDALNQAYDVEERRPWWERRLLAIGMTLALALFAVLSLAFVLIGPNVAFYAASWLRIKPVVVYAWGLARWPVIISCAVIGLDVVYHLAPNRTARWVWVTPGSLVSTALWIVSSFGFKFYVSNFGHYSATYGAIGAAIVALLWFYVSGLTILVGAELNSVIEASWNESPKLTGLE